MTKEKVARTAAQTVVLMAILTLGTKLLGFVFVRQSSQLKLQS